jgi:nudix-type nucleoside diphosphatase (YffH/AdpP family)
MSQDEIGPMKAVLNKETTEWESGPFKIVKLNTSHQRYDGQTQTSDWIKFERGDAVAIILYKEDSNEIILARQFRAPTLRIDKSGSELKLLNDGQLDETVAGMIASGESVLDCAVRVVRREAGYKLGYDRFEKIAEFYSSPGGTSERIHLFYAEVRDADQEESDPEQQARSGKDSIGLQRISVEKFFQMADAKEPLDAKVLIASMLLRLKLNLRIPTRPADPQVKRFEFVTKPGCFVVLRTGNMMNVTDVDGWVNSETLAMEMDRITAKSVSAFIRFKGAITLSGARIEEDIIADALKEAIGGRPIHQGDIFPTTSGALRRSHGVKRIFHVAAVHGVPLDGAYALLPQIAPTVEKVLNDVEKRNTWMAFRTKCRSILLPIIGTGEPGLASNDAFRETLRGISAFFERQSSPKLREVHVSALHEKDAVAAEKHLREEVAEKRLREHQDPNPRH